jgi:signal transduction histidine kinase
MAHRMAFSSSEENHPGRPPAAAPSGPSPIQLDNAPKPPTARRQPGSIERYGVALLSSLVAFALTSLLSSFVERSIFIFFFASVVGSAWYGGKGPGLLASVLAVLIVDYFFTPPDRSLHLTDPGDLIPLVLFAVIALLVSSVMESLREARVRAEEQAVDLHDQTIELEAQVAESQALSEELESTNQELEEAIARVENALLDSERAELRARFLSEAGKVLASSLDYRETLNAVAGLAVPEIADWCAVDLVGPDDSLERVAVVHPDPAKVELAKQLQERYPDDKNAPHGLYNVLRTGKSEMMEKIPEELLVASAQDAEHLRIIRELHLVSYMAVPLKTPDSMLGVISFVSTSDDRLYGPDDLRLAEDLAGRAALAIEKAQLFREAQQANEAKSRFLATMSHEFRTPLNAILGYSDLLEAEIKGPLNDEQREQLGRLRRSAMHLRDLINDVLDLSRLEAGKADLRVGVFELADLVAHTVELVQPDATEKQLELITDIADAPKRVNTDSGKLRQILLNLLSNAVKFTHKGSVKLTVRESQRSLEFEVRDTGIGVAPEQQQLLFKPFTQVDQSMTRTQGGSGLGLAVSQGLAQVLGGHITVESEPGVGSAFTLHLPIVAPDVTSTL